MATMQGIRAAQVRIKGLWTISGALEQRLADSVPTWMTELKGVSDEELMARIEAHPDSKHPPTLRELTRKPGQAAPTPDKPGVDGCVRCKGSGVRAVVRWARDALQRTHLHEVAARCPCQAGDRRKAQAMPELAEIERRWAESPTTIDGPHVDPEPAHRIAPELRAAFIERAEARLAQVHGLLKRTA